MSLVGPTNQPSAPSDQAQEAPTFLQPPQGWTNDPTEMHLEYYWRGVDEDLKAVLETDYNLLDPQPILTRDPEFGDIMFLLQSRQKRSSETKHYVWNDIGSELCLIKSPTNVEEIYQTMNETEGYLNGLELEVVLASGKVAEEED